MIEYEKLANLAKQNPLEALQIASKLLDVNKNDTQALFVIGYIFLSTGKKGLASSIYNDLIAKLRVIGNKGQLSQALNMLSTTYCEYYESEEGHKALDEAISLTPGDTALYVNKSLFHLRQNEFSKCINLCKKVLEIDPSHIISKQNIAQAYLSLQNYQEGFKYYRSPDNFILDLGLPELTISNTFSDSLLTEKKTVVVTGVQGLGDQVLFASCIPLLQEIYHVKMVVDPQLVNLFKDSFNLSDADISGELRTSNLDSDFYKDAHYQLPMCQLLKMFIKNKLDLNKVNAKYLNTGLAEVKKGLNVGISWTGGLPNTGDKVRSLSLDDLNPILDIPDVTFYSLEYNEPDAEELSKYNIKHDQSITGKGVDYKLTAQLLNSMDLIITCPTTTTHVAGALGKPVYVINPFSGTFRFPAGCNKSPFHRMTRVFNRAKDDSNLTEIINKIKDLVQEQKDLTD
jgi:tetratricopeptide (TPR) repeat protein